MTPKITYLLTGLILLSSCSPMTYSQVPGKYISSNKESKTILNFLEDGNFTFWQNNGGVIRTCAGKWEMVTKGKLNLKCEDQSEDYEKVLSSGFMEPLKEEVLLKGKRKIIMGNLILIRHKDYKK